MQNTPIATYTRNSTAPSLLWYGLVNAVGAFYETSHMLWTSTTDPQQYYLQVFTMQQHSHSNAYKQQYRSVVAMIQLRMFATCGRIPWKAPIICLDYCFPLKILYFKFSKCLLKTFTKIFHCFKVQTHPQIQYLWQYQMYVTLNYNTGEVNHLKIKTRGL
jgi:hypothetical protein